MKRFILASIMVLMLSGVAMAEDWHVKTVNSNGRSAQVVFHIPVPAGNNSASPPMSWQDALAEYIKPQDFATGTFGTWFSQLQGIDAGELGFLQAGSLLEVVDTVRFLALDTDIQKRNKIDVKFAELETSALNNLQVILTFWGFARDVP